MSEKRKAMIDEICRMLPKAAQANYPYYDPIEVIFYLVSSICCDVEENAS